TMADLNIPADIAPAE
ncbi:hypothetical protein Tco_0929638, partial [Tanacetum coccineum]